MSGKKHEWLSSSSVGWRWATLAATCWFCATFFFAHTELGSYLETKIARPTDFRVRERLGQSPGLSPQLKILSVDDRTYARLGNWTWSLETWAKLLKAIAATEPKAILIDGMFSKADASGSEGPAFLELLKDIKVPIITGSFATPSPIRFREGLDADDPHFDLKAMLLPGQDPLSEGSGSFLPPLAERKNWFAYGPDPLLAPVLKNVGHFAYEGDGRLAPLLRMLGDKAIPHMALLLAEKRRFQDAHLQVDGHTVPMDDEGMIVVNFPSPETWRKNNHSMLPYLMNVKRDKALTDLNKGDTVVILPLMWTGNADFKPTPFGILPAGFVISAAVNSVLTGNWLKPVQAEEVFFGMAALVGAFLAVHTGATLFWFALVLIALFLIGFGQYLFAYHGIITPWLMSVAAFGGSALSVFAEKTRLGEKRAQRLRHALEGAIAPSEMQSILKNPDLVNLEARERVVTLMFIDVVGFSLLAENMLPRIAFDNLKHLLSLIGETVHQYGGIIDKTLGDGLLCYFGYRFDRDQSTPDHAEKALRCAMTIQQQNLVRNLEAAKVSEPVYPLRIGVNTSSCYLGDLGSGDRIDFTVVGNGVNFTKRLEGACEMHSVLIGATTYDLVKSMGLPQAAMSKRFIRIKHHSELVESYEYDPFHMEADMRQAAVEAFRKCANIERVDHRWPVHDPSRIQLVCDAGEGQLVNFSHTGFSIRLKQFLVKGTRLSVRLDNADGALRSLLIKEGIEVLKGEIRWAYGDGAEFIHGFMLSDLGEKQSDSLVQYLCEFAFMRGLGDEEAQCGPKNAEPGLADAKPGNARSAS